MTENVDCPNCGIVFCMPAALVKARRKDHESFYCPNGHGLNYSGKTEQEKRIEQLEARGRRASRLLDDGLADREQLIGALKECPGGCGWRSRRRPVGRAPVDVGRFIERVRYDVADHLLAAHGARSVEPLALGAGS